MTTEELVKKAAALDVSPAHMTTSYLQRKLKISYFQAAVVVKEISKKVKAKP